MEIRGPRIYLRPLSENDTDWILRWRNDASIAGHMFSDPPSRADHEQFLQRLQKGGDRLEFTIVLNDGDAPVGTIGLSHIDRLRGECEYGILIGEESARGKGVAREASELLLDYAFHTLGLRRVVLNVFADNAAAIALYRRLGFRPEPDRATTRMKDGIERPTIHMVIGAPALAARS